ncbi:hypothetical protein [Clostridium botulinum]|nr:hypothetical protein [Clostridium botulinum]AEB77202.1 predicted hypothetical protein [Clostridium botulinum BKT015925]
MVLKIYSFFTGLFGLYLLLLKIKKAKYEAEKAKYEALIKQKELN